MRVTLYSKPGCHLCDDVKNVIERVRSRGHAMTLDVVNILDSPADFANFQYVIPVVAIDGKEIARYRLSEQRLLAGMRSLGYNIGTERSP